MLTSILHCLKENKDGYVSGEDISRGLKISRAAIWKYIKQLRELGYTIEAATHRGYKLAGIPDRLLPWEIQYGARTKVFGQKVVCKDEVGSTMDEAFALAMDGAPEGTAVFAERQTLGRGRMGRTWVSPKGAGLYFSLILRPSCTPNEAPKLTLMSAVAVSEAVSRITGIFLRIKWPNDLMIDGKKAGGILTEMNSDIDRVKFVVIGVGLNVNTDSGLLPEGATSLKARAGTAVPRVELVRELLRSFESCYEACRRDGFDDMIRMVKERSATLGRRVKVNRTEGPVEGEAADIAQDGALLIQRVSGEMFRHVSGDVELV